MEEDQYDETAAAYLLHAQISSESMTTVTIIDIATHIPKNHTNDICSIAGTLLLHAKTTT